MRRHRSIGVLVTALTATALALAGTVAERAQASEPAEVVLDPPLPRQGYYVSLQLFQMAGHAWEKGDALGVWPGGGYGLRLGQMVTRRLGLGLLIDFAGARGEGLGRQQTAAYSGLSIEGQYVLWDRLALLGGTGIGIVQLSYDRLMPDEPNDLRGAFGMYLLAGASYEFFPYRRALSGGLGLAPALRVRFLPGETASALAVFLGVDVTWWTGLPRNQLDLPPDKAF
ncbi:MAG: hypothetical protein QN159_12275 [Armatimonadota bacterium]|nr:hypothetical protein [Armatimonadota bacterium]